MAKKGRGYVLAKRYRIERRLGAGTSATVFEAIDTQSGERVAVKVVHHLFRKDRTIRKRFLREAEAARALVTPHAVKVLDVGQLPQGIPYLVMELLNGSTLERVIRRERGGMDVEQSLRLADQIAAGLQDAHGLDIVHRDLKPENIFVVDVGGEPFIKIVDFGISKLIGGQEVSQLTGTGVMVGTPVYMAPEQIEGWKDIDGRVDVYSLGVVMYEMLAGVSPFASATDFTGLLRMLMAEPPNIRHVRPELPEKLASLIAHAMAPNRSDRLPNMESVRVGIAPHWSGCRPSLHSYDVIAPSSNVTLRRPSVPPARDPSGPDLGELFDSEEAASSTRRRTVEPPRAPLPASSPSGAARWQQPTTGLRIGTGVLPPPVPPPRRIPPPPTPESPSTTPSPSKRAPPPPLPLRGRVPRPSVPPPRPPSASESQLVRPPMESGIGPASSPQPDDGRRDETDLRWPPRLNEPGDDED